MKAIAVQFLSLAIFALQEPMVLAQQTKEPCRSSVDYENRNQVDYGPLSIRSVSGQVIAEVGGSAEKVGLVSRACLGIFTEQDHRLIAETVADEEGRFRFKSIPSGRYRLVVQADPLCVANVPLRIVSWPRGGFFKSKKIVIHMRPASIDRCSYGDYK